MVVGIVPMTIFCIKNIILILGKHFMGKWGLLLGIPLFIFILDILGGKASDEHPKTKYLK